MKGYHTLASSAVYFVLKPSVSLCLNLIYGHKRSKGYGIRDDHSVGYKIATLWVETITKLAVFKRWKD